jgi:hypothetical protein
MEVDGALLREEIAGSAKSRLGFVHPHEDAHDHRSTPHEEETEQMRADDIILCRDNMIKDVF